MSLDVNLRTKPCELCGHSDELFWANITHNLIEMAEELDIYGILWSPEKNGVENAGQLIEPLKNAIAIMKTSQETLQRFNAKNGWGTYEQFLPWLERYLEACIKNPDAIVSASR